MYSRPISFEKNGLFSRLFFQCAGGRRSPCSDAYRLISQEVAEITVCGSLLVGIEEEPGDSFLGSFRRQAEKVALVRCPRPVPTVDGTGAGTSAALWW